MKVNVRQSMTDRHLGALCDEVGLQFSEVILASISGLMASSFVFVLEEFLRKDFLDFIVRLLELLFELQLNESKSSKSIGLIFWAILVGEGKLSISGGEDSSGSR